MLIDDGISSSRNVASINILVHEVINLLDYDVVVLRENVYCQWLCTKPNICTWSVYKGDYKVLFLTVPSLDGLPQVHSKFGFS